LNFSQNFYISDTRIFALSEGLKRLRSLSSLTPDILDLPMTDEGINHYSKALSA